MLRPSPAAPIAGRAPPLRRAVLAVVAAAVVSAVSVLCVATPAAALSARAHPQSAAQRPSAPTRDTSSRLLQDSAPALARAAGDSATAVASPSDSQATAPAGSPRSPATAQPTASRRATDSLRAAAARQQLLGGLSLVQAIIAVALATLAILLGLGALQLFERYGDMVRKDESLGLTSHWGGFGGGTSGWRASPALALLVSAIILLGGATTVAVTVVTRVLPVDTKDSTTSRPANPAPGS